MSEYVLPNGTTTTNQNEYICKWDRVARQVEQALEVRVISSNPGFQVADKDGAVASLPMWLVNKVIHLSEQRDEALGLIRKWRINLVDVVDDGEIMYAMTSDGRCSMNDADKRAFLEATRKEGGGA